MTAGPQWSHLAMEAALCVWEDMNERRVRPPEQNQSMIRLWEEFGTVHMRSLSPAIASWIVEAYEFIEPDSLDMSPYDWEIVPTFVGLVDWTGPNGKPRLMAPKAAAAVVVQKLGGRLAAHTVAREACRGMAQATA